MSEFDISQLPIDYQDLTHTFKMIFSCPSLRTTVKEKFLIEYFIKYVNDEEFSKTEYGKYLVFTPNSFEGSFDYEELEQFTERKILFHITDRIDYSERLETFLHSESNYTLANSGKNHVFCTIAKNPDGTERILQKEYLFDSGCTHIQIDLSSFVDFSTLNFIVSFTPPEFKGFEDNIRKIEFIPVDTANGVAYRIKIQLKRNIFVRIGQSHYVPFKIFLCDIPNAIFKGQVCYPGRFFKRSYSNKAIRVPLLGTNIIYKFCSIILPEIQPDNSLLRQELLKSRLIVQKININETDLSLINMILKPGLLLQFTSLENNTFVPVYDNLLLNCKIEFQDIFKTTKYLSLLCFDQMEQIDLYNKDTFPGDGYYFKDEYDCFLYLKEIDSLDIYEDRINSENYETMCLSSYIKSLAPFFFEL